jgi:hypothetical protein
MVLSPGPWPEYLLEGYGEVLLFRLKNWRLLVGPMQLWFYRRETISHTQNLTEDTFEDFRTRCTRENSTRMSVYRPLSAHYGSYGGYQEIICLNSSTEISACFRIAISVPFFNSLCKGTKNNLQYPAEQNTRSRCLIKPCLTRSFTIFCPEMTGSIQGICHH